MKKSKDTFILVVPAYNEELYIEDTILSWIKLLKQLPCSEILVINDGSTDKTVKILDYLSKNNPTIKVVHKKNEGHGKTILRGYKEAILSKHEWIFQTDGDGHYSASNFYSLWEKRQSSDFLLGHRLKRHDPFYRIILSVLASLWVYVLFGVYIKDANIPFRLIRRKYLGNLLKRIPNNVFAPNIFLSILARIDGHNLFYIPVSHKLRRKAHASTFKILKGAYKSFYELLLFKISFKGSR